MNARAKKSHGEVNGDEHLLEPPAVRQTLELIRPWIDHLPPNQRRLGLFITLSLIIHVIAFFSLRIDTTRTTETYPPHLQISMENGASDQYWDALNDPRIFVLNPVSCNQNVPHSETFKPESWKPDALPPPATLVAPIDVSSTPGVDQLAHSDLTWDKLPIDYQPPPVLGAKSSTWVWDATLMPRKPSVIPSLPSPTSNIALVATELSVAVDEEGTVQHVLLEQSCGKADLDRVALLALRRLHFQALPSTGAQPPIANLQWGKASVFWNFTPEPVENATPILVPSGQ